jgi:disease resistance protein RPM1
MEEVAEGYLYELVNRSLLQVVERNESGRVQSCRMHDIIRLLALTKANEEGFCKVYDGMGSSSAEKTRRLSIHSANIKQLTQPTDLTVRSIYVFSNGLTID